MTRIFIHNELTEVWYPVCGTSLCHHKGLRFRKPSSLTTKGSGHTQENNIWSLSQRYILSIPYHSFLWNLEAFTFFGVKILKNNFCFLVWMAYSLGCCKRTDLFQWFLGLSMRKSTLIITFTRNFGKLLLPKNFSMNMIWFHGVNWEKQE